MKKEKETHELICSWARTHDDCDGERVAQYGGHKLVDRDKQPWFTVNFFDIGHPSYVQLTPLKTEYPLTRIT